MEKFVIYKEISETNREYVYYIQRNSVSFDKDIGDAIEFTNKELALSMATYLENRSTANIKLKVLSIKTTYETIE